MIINIVSETMKVFLISRQFDIQKAKGNVMKYYLLKYLFDIQFRDA